MTDRASGNGQPDGLPPPGTGRRRSLIFLVILLLGLPVAFVVRSALDDGWRAVTSVEALEERDVIYLPQIGVFLVYGEPPLALSSVSPHLGDRIVYCPDGELFTALGHGERFERTGRYRSGPDGRDMTRVASRVRNGVMEINLQMISRDRSHEPPGRHEDVFRGICNFKHWSERRPGFLEREEAQR